ncbi:hypothetical protein JCM9140_1366 [Halalkalibacter wakoensis JCM 9140]|uniref:Uncharacterized protein n=1 Tax=Halalkalibacter wakoensis JCM 9140 TaxID=1236970 RepID=W4Q0A3_9BACI|nr:hypothetical protein JCM9140_1366 [Halalkalibacter wakoensis JCM 9140]
MSLKLEKETPFGTIHSSVLSLHEQMVTANLELSSEQKDGIMESLRHHLLNFSSALAFQSEGRLDSASDYIVAAFYELMNSSWDYLGYLSEVVVDVDSFILEQVGDDWFVRVDVQEKWIEDYVQNGYSMSLQESTQTNEYRLKYETTSQKWTVQDWSARNGLNSTHLKDLDINVSEQKEQLESTPLFASLSQVREPSIAEFGRFLDDYLTTSVEAINQRDFSIVVNMIDPAAATYKKEASDYIDYLERRGIKEDFHGVEVRSVERKSDDVYCPHV